MHFGPMRGAGRDYQLAEQSRPKVVLTKTASRRWVFHEVEPLQRPLTRPMSRRDAAAYLKDLEARGVIVDASEFTG